MKKQLGIGEERERESAMTFLATSAQHTRTSLGLLLLLRLQKDWHLMKNSADNDGSRENANFWIGVDLCVGGNVPCIKTRYEFFFLSIILNLFIRKFSFIYERNFSERNFEKFL